MAHGDRPAHVPPPAPLHPPLHGLRCESGGAPHYRYVRRGPRGPYGNQTEHFELRCVLDDESHAIVIDRHHPGHVEDEPVPGFRVAD